MGVSCEPHGDYAFRRPQTHQRQLIIDLIYEAHQNMPDEELAYNWATIQVVQISYCMKL